MQRQLIHGHGFDDQCADILGLPRFDEAFAVLSALIAKDAEKFPLVYKSCRMVKLERLYVRDQTEPFDVLIFFAVDGANIELLGAHKREPEF
ncbi:MAG: hypothetical protein V4675_06940 [Verrucomicrobiota bacterium]